MTWKIKEGCGEGGNRGEWSEGAESIVVIVNKMTVKVQIPRSKRKGSEKGTKGRLGPRVWVSKEGRSDGHGVGCRK